ncbi:MAG: DUF2971 domain-containing protein [Oscillospiraceae bacterium]|nr:DUF2971 domain-containing protein [Oscillospiraceae bacterium]
MAYLNECQFIEDEAEFYDYALSSDAIREVYFDAIEQWIKENNEFSNVAFSLLELGYMCSFYEEIFDSVVPYSQRRDNDCENQGSTADTIHSLKVLYELLYNNKDDSDSKRKKIVTLIGRLRQVHPTDRAKLSFCLGKNIRDIAYSSANKEIKNGLYLIAEGLFKLAEYDGYVDAEELNFFLGTTYALLGNERSAIEQLNKISLQYVFSGERNAAYWLFTTLISSTFVGSINKQTPCLDRAMSIAMNPTNSLNEKSSDTFHSTDDNTIGWVLTGLYMQQKYEDVIATFNSCLPIYDSFPKWPYLFSLFEMGKFDDAKSILSECLSRDFSSQTNRRYYDWFQKLHNSLEGKDEKTQEDLCMLSYLCLKIYQLSAYDLRDDSSQLLYYTKLSSLNEMLKNRKIDKNDINQFRQHRFPVFEARHMNDTTEGQLLFEYLGVNVADTLECDYVFLKSFMQASEDSLGMWAKYGDDGQGCYIAIGSGTFTKSVDIGSISENHVAQTDEYSPLIVSYLDSNGNVLEGTQNSKQIEKYLIQLKNIVSRLGSEPQYNGFMLHYLSRIRYLFKHKCYADEREVRILITRKVSQGDFIQEISSVSYPFPRLCIYLEQKVQIEKIIFGPKLTYINNYLPFLQKQLSVINDPVIGVPTIEKSSIPYQ